MKTAAVIRVTKQFNFEMAHALYGYDGPCKNIHGHSYRLSVTVSGKTISETEDSKLGMVIDFSDLKKIVNENIVKKFDHSLVLNENTPHKDFLVKNLLFGEIILVKFQPTCENMLAHFAETLKNKFERNVRLHHLKLRETPSSYAEWFSEDNN